LFFVVSSLNPFKGIIAFEYIGRSGVFRIGSKYFVRLDIAPETLLPDSMSDLRKYSKDRPSNLLAVDAIVSRWTMTGKRPLLELLEGALLIQGRAAYEVTDRGL
jgi:hypothetical protein